MAIVGADIRFPRSSLADLGIASSLGGTAFKLGDVAIDESGAEPARYVLCRSLEIIAAHKICAMVSPYRIEKLTRTNAQEHARIVLPMTLGTTVNNDYVWCLTEGLGTVEVAGNTPVNVALYVAGTSGRLTDTETDGVYIPEVTLTLPRGAGSGPAACRIDRVRAHAL